MRILVIGAGALGSFVGARLAAAGHGVVLVGRQSLVESVQGHGLTLVEPAPGERETRRHLPDVAAVGSVAAAFAAPAAYDLALITAKAYDTAALTTELRGVTASPPPLLTLQNGVGNEELLAATFGDDSVLAGAIDTPVSVPAPGVVQVHRGVYRIGLAPVGRGAPVQMAAAALAGAGFQVGVSGDYRGLKWTKLLMNMLANAQCAILDWTPAQVMSDPRAARLEARAWQEALAVMAGLGIRPVTLAGYPFPLLAPLVRRLPPVVLGRLLRSFVSGGRGSKMPSLHMALSAGRRSEVTWLNGAVVRYGQQIGLPTPTNALFCDTLTALSEGRVSRDAYRGQPQRLLAAA